MLINEKKKWGEEINFLFTALEFMRFLSVNTHFVMMNSTNIDM